MIRLSSIIRIKLPEKKRSNRRRSEFKRRKNWKSRDLESSKRKLQTDRLRLTLFVLRELSRSQRDRKDSRRRSSKKRRSKS